MRVIVNYLAASDTKKTGIGHYTAELMRCLSRQAEGNVIDPFPGHWGQQAHRALMSYRRERMPFLGTDKTPEPPSLSGSLRRQLVGRLRKAGRSACNLYFRWTCRWGGYDLYHEPNNIPLPCDLPTVTTLHDLSALLHPEWHPAERVARYQRSFERGLAQCSHILTVSDFVRQEVIDTLGVPAERVTRTYNGIRPGLRPLPARTTAEELRRLGLPPRYLLYLGTIEPRKNLLTLLRAYGSLPSSLRREYPLLLVGNWGWNADDIAVYLHDEGRHQGVLHCSYIAEEYLGVLYNGARALVYPSLYEGFGLPPVEMLACGGAVLASTAGALVETVGTQAHLTEPLDVDGWRTALQRVLTDDDWWRQLRTGAVEAARPFTWEQCAAGTLAVYRSLTGTTETVRRRVAA